MFTKLISSYIDLIPLNSQCKLYGIFWLIIHLDDVVRIDIHFIMTINAIYIIDFVINLWTMSRRRRHHRLYCVDYKQMTITKWILYFEIMLWRQFRKKNLNETAK
jgi:hypothetical protein